MSLKLARLCARTAALCIALTSGISYAQTTTFTLEEALQRAGVESPQISISEAEIDIAEGNERQAGIGPNPEVSLEVENVAGSGAFSGLRSNETTLMLTQPIELGGKRGARVRAAEARSIVAEFDAQIAQADLALLVRQRYTDAVTAKEQMELARDVLERSTELYRIANELVIAGREPPLRAIRAQAALGNAETNLAIAEADYLNARLALAELWGASSPPETIETLWLNPDNVTVAQDITDSLTMRRANAELLAAEAAVERERRSAVPDLNIGAGIRRFEESNDTAFTVGASMAIPLRNRNQGSIAAASAEARATEGRMLLMRLQLQREYSTLLNRVDALQQRVETIESLVLPLAEEALDLARTGYRYGKFNLIDVLDAAATRDDARNTLISAREDLAKSTASLVRLTQTQRGNPS